MAKIEQEEKEEHERKKREAEKKKHEIEVAEAMAKKRREEDVDDSKMVSIILHECLDFTYDRQLCAEQAYARLKSSTVTQEQL